MRQAEYAKGLSDFTKINTGTHSSRGGAEGTWRRRSTADTGCEVEMKVEFGPSRRKGEGSGKACRRDRRGEAGEEGEEGKEGRKVTRANKRGASQGEGSG